MSAEIIERVSAALAFTSDKVGRGSVDFYDILARAAILAMREPTEEMINRGDDILGWPPSDCLGDKSKIAAAAWRAMIDAALEGV